MCERGEALPPEDGSDIAGDRQELRAGRQVWQQQDGFAGRSWRRAVVMCWKELTSDVRVSGTTDGRSASRWHERVAAAIELAFDFNRET